jgi:hypothetical protein
MTTRLSGILREFRPPPTACRVLLWTGIAMIVLGLASIGIAERFMPANGLGRQGIVTFYRSFGPFILSWTVISAWAYVGLQTRSKGRKVREID